MSKLTYRFREPRGLFSEAGQYTFSVRLNEEDRALLKKASGIAVGRFGMRGIPSNPLLLHEILSFYVANANGRKEPEKQRTEEPKVSALEL